MRCCRCNQTRPCISKEGREGRGREGDKLDVELGGARMRVVRLHSCECACGCGCVPLWSCGFVNGCVRVDVQACRCVQCVHACAHTPSHLPLIAHSPVPHTHLPLTHWDLRELSHEDHEHVPPVSLLQEFSMSVGVGVSSTVGGIVGTPVSVGTAVGCSVGAKVVAPDVAAKVRGCGRA